MKYIVLQLILFCGMLLLFDIIHLLVGLLHRSHVKSCDDNEATICIYVLSRSVNKGFTEFHFRREYDKWKYMINKDDILVTALIAGVLMLGTIVYLVKAAPSIMLGINAIIAVLLVAIVITIYHPLRAYCILKRHLRKIR